MGDTNNTVLVVEDERRLADLYADHLDDEYDVRVAYSGIEALEKLSADVDAMLLDRRMPEVSGSEVLAVLADRGIECRVALVTAVNADFDIIDLGIDDYLVKPVTGEEVRSTVNRLLTIDEYNQRVRELSAKKVKRNVLEVEKTDSELAESDEFDRLTDEIETLEAEVESIENQFDVEGLEPL